MNFLPVKAVFFKGLEKGFLQKNRGGELWIDGH